MKIRLIQPAQLDDRGRPTKFKQLFFPNLGLPTLAGMTPEGIEVGITVEYVDEIDFDETVDLVAVTAQTCQAPRAYQIAEEFKKRGRKTIVGGIHASACPDEALRHFDAVLIGEAEGLWEEVLADVRRGSLKRLYRSAQKPEMTRLVIPRYDLLDYKKYVVPPFARTPLLPIQTTRGCPYHCDFCSVTEFWGPRIRTKPIAHVMKEIEALTPSRVFFTDDNIGADPVYAKELFRALKPLKMRWACQMSTTIMQDPELIELAGEAGCHETFMGIESMDPDNLQSIHKTFNKTADYASLLTRMKEAGILAQVSIIFGLDQDTVSSLQATMEKLLEWDINYVYIALLTPFPGTRLHQRMTEEGRIIDKDWSRYDVTRVVFRPQRMSPAELERVMWDLYARYYSPGNIFKRVHRFRKEYFFNFPRDNAIEEVFFQWHIKNSIEQHCHPFSLGLGDSKVVLQNTVQPLSKEVLHA